MTKSIDINNQHTFKSGICLVALVPVRKAPREQSEMISQLLFGEYYVVVEILDKWLKIITSFDHYSGWIDRKFFHPSDVPEIANLLQTVLYSKISEIELPDGSSQIIPAGSSLPHYNAVRQEFTIGKQRYRVKSLSGALLLPPSQKIFETARQFMNAPYLWGGRSVFGFDCSGFIQSVYKIHGQSLPKDTREQVLRGQTIPSLSKAVPGDLAFFNDKKGEVNHIGMVLEDKQIIHCSGWVRIDRLDEKGIFNLENGVYTHLLKEVRRVSVIGER